MCCGNVALHAVVSRAVIKKIDKSCAVDCSGGLERAGSRWATCGAAGKHIHMALDLKTTMCKTFAWSGVDGVDGVS